MRLISIAALAALVLLASTADAGPLKRLRERRQGDTYSATEVTTPQGTYTAQQQQVGGVTATSEQYRAADGSLAVSSEALEEVNNARRARGLRPFLMDPNLTAGAMAAAAHRARFRMSGHTPNDFQFLPPGTAAAAGGCAAWPQGMGWGSCCTYDNYTYAGAGYAIGPDGKRYMHLFVK